MKKEVHIWDLQEMKAKIVTDLDEALRDEIGYKIKENLSQLAKELNIQPSRLFEYFIWKKSFIPIDILFNISKRLSIPKERVERAIRGYKQQGVPLKNSINNPKLPISIDPYLTSIVSHLYFDGSMPKDGKGAYYNQKSKSIWMDLLEN